MARAGIKNYTIALFFRGPFSVQGVGVGRCMSRTSVAQNHRIIKSSNKVVEGPAVEEEEVEERRREDTGSCWMPHPRTGIYFPKGQEWVMEDIPNDAASFDCTFWLRSIDGVDHEKPDPHHNCIHTIN
ncbi:hypothetical protein Salat_1618100 [Sesamum alatum]|uniref:Late embryogenesis abundant protein n=1 Tax=Sesamum alatum TaxID=300844 RepID=A0AAE2CJ99_9LAMI|nr:hypothetical protein Salat_1618100 [Sesamum alatum]